MSIFNLIHHRQYNAEGEVVNLVTMPHEYLDVPQAPQPLVHDFDYEQLGKFISNQVPEELVDRIYDYYKKSKESSDGIEEWSDHLAGKVSSENKIDMDKLQEEDPELFDDFVSLIGKHIEFMNNRPLNSLDIEEFWVNEMVAGDHNPPHRHSGRYSFVMYLDVPEEIRRESAEDVGTVYSTGLLQFLSPYNSHMHTFNPKKGDILIFNSSLLHMVHPFKTEGVTRVSLAGNIGDYELMSDEEMIEMMKMQSEEA